MTGQNIRFEDVPGTWKLVKAFGYDQAGNVISQPYGPEPMGRLILTENGRMMAVLGDGRTHIPDGGKRAYASYTGNYVVENNTLTTTVDAALDPSRIGGKQVRRLAMDGELLVLMPPRRADGEQRILHWQRTGPA